jgi:hypothetical protein
MLTIEQVSAPIGGSRVVLVRPVVTFREISVVVSDLRVWLGEVPVGWWFGGSRPAAGGGLSAGAGLDGRDSQLVNGLGAG